MCVSCYLHLSSGALSTTDGAKDSLCLCACVRVCVWMCGSVYFFVDVRVGEWGVDHCMLHVDSSNQQRLVPPLFVFSLLFVSPSTPVIIVYATATLILICQGKLSSYIASLSLLCKRYNCITAAFCWVKG